MIKYFKEQKNLQLIDLIKNKEEKHKINLLCNQCNKINE